MPFHLNESRVPWLRHNSRWPEAKASTGDSCEEIPSPTEREGGPTVLRNGLILWRFIKGFAKIADPLHALTRKDEVNFQEPFVLETDASIKGLGAILSQRQGYGKLHPVAYASRVLSLPKKNYGISELETLAVVWAINHYHLYLYSHEVTVLMDHSAVNASWKHPAPVGSTQGGGTKFLEVEWRRLTLYTSLGRTTARQMHFPGIPHHCPLA